MESEIKTFCYRNREENNLKETKAGKKSIKKKMIISAACVMLALIAMFGMTGFAGESDVFVSADAVTGTADNGADGIEKYAADNGADGCERYTADNGADESREYTADAGADRKSEETYTAEWHRQKLTRIAFSPCSRIDELFCEGLPADGKGSELILFNEDNNGYDATENYIPVMTGKEPEESVPGALVYTYNEDMCKKLSEREYEILCRIVEAEAGDQDIYGEMLVANVIINRMNDPHFPDTVEEVVFQKIGNSYQFSPTNDGRYYTVEISEQTVQAVDRVLAGEDYSSGSEYFFQRSLTSKKNSTWFEENLDFVVKYGCHEFYREK